MMNADPKIQQQYRKKNILITGAGGYIGSHLVNALSEMDCHIVRMSRRKLDTKRNCVATFTDIQSDFLAFNDWENLISSVDFIFHLGAQTGIKNADDFPVKDAETNIISLLKILEAAKNMGDKVVILAGTATQYGFQEKLPVNEDALDSPITLYDLNKLITEQYLHYFCKNHGVRGTCLRLSNVYGPGLQSSNNSRGVMNQVIQNAMAGKEITLFDGGEFIRDYIYIDDIISAFILAGVYNDKLTNSHYVIGTGHGVTVKDAFDLVKKCVQEKTGVVVSVSNRASPTGILSEHRHFIADSNAFSGITHWQPQYSLSQGIDATIDAYQQEHTG